MRSTVIALVTLLSITAVAALAAQTEPRGLVGKRVRITMPDTMRAAARLGSARPLMVTGQLVAMSDSTMSVRNDVTSSDVTVPLARVQRLQVSTGSRRGASALNGGLIGLGVGGVVGYALGDDCTGNEFLCFPRQEGAAAGALAGAAIGSVIGLLAGWGEHWRDTLVPARVSIVPTGTRSISFTSTLRF